MYIIKVNISGEGRVCSTLLQSLHLSDIPAYVRFSICLTTNVLGLYIQFKTPLPIF